MTAMNRTILFILCTLVSDLLKHKAEALSPETIVGGDKASEDKFRYQVSIQIDGAHLCGGGIIDDMLISTVAHCIINETEGRFINMHYRVVATGNVLYEYEMIASADVEKAYLLKKFDLFSFSIKSVLEMEEEFIILKLKEGLGLSWNPLLRKLKISKEVSSYFWKNLVITGYGTHDLSPNGTQLSTDGNLRYAITDIVNNTECSKFHNTTIRSFHICARIRQSPEMIRGVCHGDSGGPLVKNEVLIGVLVSGSNLCSERRRPGVYMKTSYYSTFISDAKKGVTSNMRVFSLIKIASEYKFIEDQALYELKPGLGVDKNYRITKLKTTEGSSSHLSNTYIIANPP